MTDRGSFPTSKNSRQSIKDVKKVAIAEPPITVNPQEIQEPIKEEKKRQEPEDKFDESLRKLNAIDEISVQETLKREVKEEPEDEYALLFK